LIIGILEWNREKGEKEKGRKEYVVGKSIKILLTHFY